MPSTAINMIANTQPRNSARWSVGGTYGYSKLIHCSGGTSSLRASCIGASCDPVRADGPSINAVCCSVSGRSTSRSKPGAAISWRYPSAVPMPTTRNVCAGRTSCNVSPTCTPNWSSDAIRQEHLVVRCRQPTLRRPGDAGRHGCGHVERAQVDVDDGVRSGGAAQRQEPGLGSPQRCQVGGQLVDRIGDCRVGGAPDRHPRSRRAEAVALIGGQLI